MPQKVVSEVGEVGKIVLWHSEQFLTSFEAFFKGKWLFRGQKCRNWVKIAIFKTDPESGFWSRWSWKTRFMAFWGYMRHFQWEICSFLGRVNFSLCILDHKVVVSLRDFVALCSARSALTCHSLRQGIFVGTNTIMTGSDNSNVLSADFFTLFYVFYVFLW